MFDITFIRAALFGLLGMLAGTLQAAGTGTGDTARAADPVTSSASRASGYHQWANYAPYFLFAVSADFLESPFDTSAAGDRGGPATAD
jgi:hypothetical protein